jgi:hypothetical protein
MWQHPVLPPLLVVQAAMKTRDAGRLDAIRFLSAAIKQREIQLRETGKQVGIMCAQVVAHQLSTVVCIAHATTVNKKGSALTHHVFAACRMSLYTVFADAPTSMVRTQLCMTCTP